MGSGEMESGEMGSGEMEADRRGNSKRKSLESFRTTDTSALGGGMVRIQSSNKTGAKTGVRTVRKDERTERERAEGRTVG